ncbi:MAG: DUF1697 domain-containing protein [Candidatus Dormiibacterota bacterium]
MATYVILLRGINVGRNRRLAMADLRELLAGLGATDVRTHLNSGNAVFTSTVTNARRLERDVEEAIEISLGMTVRCMLRTGAEMRAVVEGNPLRGIASDGSRLLALFLSVAPDPRLVTAHNPLTLDPDRVRIGDRVIYQWCPDGFLAAPPVGGYVEKHLGVGVTARNWNTVTKLADLATSTPARH